ncbi:alkaline phosphatase D family protein [Planktothrix agardhii]|uniref:alkaline phosphatase D family protein n=1 Tax=Planktothrix agardhii TaxID=1160 RepID=UPI0020A83470|nr:alkaline phosphatase D family protein [Planktothrix agardhii]CAD5969635.1 Putative alkaline phosphatase [Planktothrix agardhii]
MLSANGLFNESFYLAQNPDVAVAVASGIIANGFQHFIESGQFQVRQPSPLYDESYYLATNPDVAQLIKSGAFASGFQHYINLGQLENRSPSVLFDSTYYLTENPALAAIVAQGNITGIEHFVNFGQFEDRSPTPFYNSNYYLAKNPDVAIAVARDELTGIEHYINIGAAENRQFTPFIQPQGSSLPNRVATGDTTPNSTVFLTRSSAAGTVSLEYANNLSFINPLGILYTTVTDITEPVKLTANNLTPNTQYFYRFTNAEGTSSVGSFRTPAAIGTQQGLRFGATADGQGELMPYMSVNNVPERNLDFFVGLGNTISADTISPDLPGVEQAVTPLDFRTKYNEIVSPRLELNPWANLQAATTIYSNWNDQNLITGFAGGEIPALSPQQLFFGTDGQFINNTDQFNIGLQAWKEYNPVGNQVYGKTGDPRTTNQDKLYRYQPFGSDGALFVLDARSFRDAPLPQVPDPALDSQINQFLASSFDPNRTLLGKAQLDDLKIDLLEAQNSGVSWKFIFSPVPIQNLGLYDSANRWEGYASERRDLLQFIDQNNIKNVVFVSGGAGGTIVNELTYQLNFDQPQIKTDAIEITVGPIGYQLNLGESFIPGTWGSEIMNFSSIDTITQDTKDFYSGLDTASSKDQLVQNILNNQLNQFGYDPIGLDETKLNSELIKGSYFAVHNFGWTEFIVDPQTQKLQVNVYGIEPYTQTDIQSIPANIINRQPEVISQFVINSI